MASLQNGDKDKMKIKIVEYWAFDGLVERYALRDGEKHILLGRIECSESFQYDDTEKYLNKYLPEARALACINWLIEINKFGRTCNPVSYTHLTLPTTPYV